MTKTFLCILQACIILCIISCDGGNMPETKTTMLTDIKDVPNEQWEKLAAKKIYFGHQSVGFNIINGINDLMKENSKIQLKIVEVFENDLLCEEGCFGHFRVEKKT